MSFLDQPLVQILLKPKRMIGNIAVQVVLSETANDTLTITKQPVQQGASITDHAYKEPTTFNTTIYFKDNLTLGQAFSTLGGSSTGGLARLYQDLIVLQISRVPFDIVTPKRIYKDMLLASISQTTDKNTENCLAVSLSCQQVIIVQVSAVTTPRKAQKNPGRTGATQPSGPKSALKSLSEIPAAISGRIP